MSLLSDFDFNLLKDPAFKEDSVREELISPMLKALGYSASPPNQIRRSVALTHPYVYLGTKPHRIKIIPDYLITRGGVNFLVIDAKAPGEQIRKGKHVEQAYSYAMHRDVRADLFALCNGHEFVLFHVSHWPEVLSFSMKEIGEAWGSIVRLLGTDSEVKKVIIKPDFGLHILRLGLAFDKDGKKVHQIFVTLDVDFVARIDEETYALNSHLEMDGLTFLATFDFSKQLLPKFLDRLEPKEVVADVTQGLSRYPFKWQRSPSTLSLVGVSCHLGEHVLHNENEDYCPFVVTEFI